MSQNGTQVARRDASAVQAGAAPRTLKDALDAREREFAAALASRVDVGSFIRAALTTISKSPQLAECTTASVMLALLEAASLGLVVNGVMGEAYLVPFNNKIKEDGKPDRWEKQAQFIPGYRGLVKLARNTGVVKTIVARPVRQGDVFEVTLGLDESIRHVRDFDDDDYDSRPLRYVYAVAHFTDGFKQFEVMSKKAVDKIRQRSKSKDNGPWVTDYDEMALKTVIRRLCKRLPLSDFDLARAIEADDRDVVEGAVVGVTSSGSAPRETRTERLVERLGAAPAADGYSDPAGEPIEASARIVEAGEGEAPGGEEDAEPATAETGMRAAEQRFVALVLDTKKGDGKKPAASDEDRAKLRGLAELLPAGGEPQAGERVAQLAADPALSAAQSRKLLLFAAEANLIAAGNAEPDQEQEAAAAAAATPGLFAE